MLRKIIEFDADWSRRFTLFQQWEPLRKCIVVLAHSGDSWFWGAGLVVLWFAGTSFWKEWALVEFFWISAMAVLVMALKFAIRRKRPEGDWGAIYREGDPHSFPSGHAARAFMIAVLAAGLGPDWLATALWIWAPLVALARVVMGVHYLADVIAGFVLGIAVAVVGLAISPGLFAAAQNLVGFPLW